MTGIFKQGEDMPSQASATVASHPCITSEGGLALVAAGFEHADKIGSPSAVAVLDRGGNLLAFGRQDGAPLIAGPYAIKKAWTSVSVGTPTQGLWEFVSTDRAMHTNIAGDPELLVLGGGVPLMVDSEVAGAIGVSGGTYAQDDEIAKAAAAAFSE
jgi:glc operon protein GlcG